MKELEKHINGSFAKAMEHMEEEEAFWDAWAKWRELNRCLEEARSDTLFCEHVGDTNGLASAKSRKYVAERAMPPAVRAYEIAKKNMFALSKDVLQAKADFAEVKYRLAMAKYLRYDREVCIARILRIVDDDKEAAQKQLNDAYVLRNAAALEMEKAKEKCEMFETFRRG